MKTSLCFILILFTFLPLAFVPNSFAQGTDYTVQVIYFYPNDHAPPEDSVTTLKTIIKEIQEFYADEMERHGYSRKTFRLETDENGDIAVRYIKGQHPSSHYSKDIAEREIARQLDMSKKRIYLIWVDRYHFNETQSEVSGHAFGMTERGVAWNFPNNSDSSAWRENRAAWVTIAHELGHAFGLLHDFRDNTYIMSYGRDLTSELSACTAEWLNKHIYFNDTTPVINNNTQILQTLTPILVEQPATIRLQFDVSDPDGLYQAQLHGPEKTELIDYQKLSENRTTIQFETDMLLGNPPDVVSLLIMDGFGNFTKKTIRFNIDHISDTSEIVIFNEHPLASAVREWLDLAPDRDITERNMSGLIFLYAKGLRISDLTGLEHAHNLRELRLELNTISDVSSLSKLTQLRDLKLNRNDISDISPLKTLSNLQILAIGSNDILDISSLTELTQLKTLYLHDNAVLDLSPLAKLTELKTLFLQYNQISDVSPLKGLVNLQELHLYGNPIKDKKPLLELLRINPNVKIYLENREDSLPVNLSYFHAEHTKAGVVLKWTTESEVDNAGFYIYRSTTRDGEFKIVNPTMIQGAGTTGERNEYTWTDTTAKPNTIYYYRIEDVSHAGVREQLATVRLRGLVSARGKLTTIWADLKAQE